MENQPINVEDRPNQQRGQGRNRVTERSQNFRRRIGAQVTAERKKELDIKLFADHGGLEGYARTINFHPTNQAIVIPITTRGIGFAINETSYKLAMTLPGISIPVPALYRTALALMQAKLHAAGQAQTEFCNHETLERPLMRADMFELCKAHPKHLSTVTNIVNSVGNVVVNETAFYPRRSDQASFGLLISNLRDHVQSMAAPATPLLDRQFGAMTNSIPSAIYGMAPPQIAGQPQDPATIHLTNPDFVIPAQYDINELNADFISVRAFLQRVEKKFPTYVGDSPMVATGSASMLVSTRLPAENQLHLSSGIDVNGDLSLEAINGDASDYYSLRSIPANSCVMGVIALTGEVRVLAPANVIRPQHCIRLPSNSCQAFSLSYVQTTGTML